MEYLTAVIHECGSKDGGATTTQHVLDRGSLSTLLIFNSKPVSHLYEHICPTHASMETYAKR